MLLVAGLVALWALANSAWVDRLLSRLVERALKRFTDLDVKDYEGLLHLAGDYRIAEIPVESGGWLDGRPLRELRPADEGILVLGILTGHGEWLGTPDGDSCPEGGDTLVVYGRTAAIRALSERRTGDATGRRWRSRTASPRRSACALAARRIPMPEGDIGLVDMSQPRAQITARYRGQSPIRHTAGPG